MEKDLPANIKFWLDGADHDCFFIVGPESGPTERIGALTVFLKGYSEPMRAMFGGSEIAERADVRVVDVEPDIFKVFLKCIYGGSELIIPKLSFEELAKLLYICEKYLVNEIKAKTVSRISQLLAPQNIFIAISHKVWLQENSLKTSILRMLRNNGRDILSDEQFFKLNGNDLLWILQQEEFNVREIKIWNAVLKWARRTCKNGETLRSLIFPLLGHIRFLTMEFKEFCKDVVPSGVLSKEEIFVICSFIGTGELHNMNNLCINTNHRNRFSISRKLFISHIQTSSNCMSIFCTVKNVSDIENLEVSQSFEWLQCHWSTYAGKVLQDDKNCLHLGFYCKIEGKYSVRIRHEFILISKKGRNPNFIVSGTYDHEEGQTGRGYIHRLGQSKHLGYIFEDSLSFIVHVEVLNIIKC